MHDDISRLAGQLGGFRSWANTVDRTARTAPARSNSPSGIDYWVARLDPERFADASDEQKHDAALAARRAYFASLGKRSAVARQRSRETSSLEDQVAALEEKVTAIAEHFGIKLPEPE